MHSRHARFTAPNPEIEARVQRLIDQLELEEKITLLGGKPGAGCTQGVARVGIPELKMADGPMGVHWWCDASTAYPALIAATASFDQDLWYRLGEALGRDCRARGVHILLAPGVNLYRSPLCGRNFEYAGEDPFLASRVAVNYVRGVQDQGVSCTIKHYAVNFQEYNRHHVSSDVDERPLFELYLPAFEAAVTEGGTGCLMTAYNLVNGVHCSEHAPLIQDVLKGRWGFDGLVMSDWVSVYGAESAANAGLDLEMPTADYLNHEHLLPAVREGRVQETVIDDKLRRLLRLAACFGWLDHEQKDDSIPYDDPATAEVALEAARKGVVLLENREGFLPLDPARLKKLAVIGPQAHPAVYGGGGSSLTPPHRAVSVLDGVKALAGPDVEVLHATGPDPNPEHEVFAHSHFESDRGPGLWGEYFNNDQLEGEPVLERLDERLNFTWGTELPIPEITRHEYSIRWTGAFRPTESGRHAFYTRSHNSLYRVLVDGEVVFDVWNVERNGPHRFELDLEAGRRYALKIEWRKTRYSGALQFGWHRDDGGERETAHAVEVARQADVALLCVGFDQVSESEGFDRPFAMPALLENLVRRVSEANPRVAVVLTAGGNVDMSRWADGTQAVLHSFFPGQAGGQAVAEILFGRVNPSGRLPATFEHRLEDRSSFDSYHDDDGDLRVVLSDGIWSGYRHFDARGIQPRYPFGYGLSYTSFAISELSLSTAKVERGASVTASVSVTNTGERAGAQVVQVYVGQLEPRVERPLKQLAGFARVELEPGETRRVEVEIAARSFQVYDVQRHGWVFEPGRYRVFAGEHAGSVPLTIEIDAV